MMPARSRTASTSGLLLLLLVLLLLVAACRASPPSAVVRRRRYADAAPALASGRVLARSATSMRARGDVFQYGPQILTAAGCEARCAEVRECNAWRFCAGGDAAGGRAGGGGGLPRGCGKGCLAFARASALPRQASIFTLEAGRDCGPWPDSVCARVGARLSSPTDRKHATAAGGRPTTAAAAAAAPAPHLPPQPVPPFDALGPYNLGVYGVSPCQHACANGTVPPSENYGYAGLCKRLGAAQQPRGGGRAPPGPEVLFSDRWAAGTCTLLRVRDPSAPALDRGLAPRRDAPDGWVGGTIEKPARCANVSADACERCAAAAAAAAAEQKGRRTTASAAAAAAAPGFRVSAVQAGGEAACLACAARRTLLAWDVITGHDGVRVECQAAEEQEQARRQRRAGPTFQVRSSCGAQSAAGLDCTVSRESAARRCAGFSPQDAGRFDERTCRFVWPTADGAARPLIE